MRIILITTMTCLVTFLLLFFNKKTIKKYIFTVFFSFFEKKKNVFGNYHLFFIFKNKT